MVQMSPCDWLITVEHIAIAFFGMCSTVIGLFLVHRRILADRDRKRRNGYACKNCGLPTRAHNLEDLCQCTVPQP